MYKVLNTFREKYHDNHVYSENDTYPADGFEADPERVKFLQSKHPKYGVAFLNEIAEKSKDPAPRRTPAKAKEKPAPVEKSDE